MISKKTFALFAELEANNNRTWFKAHRDEITKSAVIPLTSVIEQTTAALSSSKLPMMGGANTLFRINRDIRFSKNKAPYKTQVSGLLTPDGTKLADEGVAYIQLDQRGGHMSAGYYNLTPDVLKRIRDRIVESPNEFRAVLKSLDKANLKLTREMTLTAMPRGYSKYADEWFAEYLKLKVFLVRTKLTKQPWMSGTIVKDFVEHTLQCAPLVRFGQSTT